MLVIVEDGNAAAFFQFPFNFKTAGGRNIFQIDSSERSLQKSNRIDNFIHIPGSNAKRYGIHIAERLEKDTLPFHHRHSSYRPDVSQAKNCCAVRHDGNSIPAARQFVAEFFIFLDFKTRLRNTGRVSE